jgi:hypothetical protein
MDGDHLKTLIMFWALLLSMPLSAAQLDLQLGATHHTGRPRNCSSTLRYKP